MSVATLACVTVSVGFPGTLRSPFVLWLLPYRKHIALIVVAVAGSLWLTFPVFRAGNRAPSSQVTSVANEASARGFFARTYNESRVRRRGGAIRSPSVRRHHFARGVSKGTDEGAIVVVPSESSGIHDWP